ncbi:putative penicillin-binding protein [Rhexocercosporidium sp. MPI-PUGE-AT-0058]|nr:putative penicillin-binding protein [Rhexocercosporidium sp. MPI-PUGE-AT-0058]
MAEALPLIRDGSFTPEFDELVAKSLRRWKAPGLSIAVISNDEVLAKGFGYSQYPDKPVKPETLFNAASMTKAFTATAVSLLVDDEKQFPDVKWTTPVANLIGDDFVLSDNRTDQVTVEDILSHRTGLPDCDDACYGIDAKVPDTPKSVTRKLRHIPLSQPLRTTFQYSNVMFTVAAHLIERLSGQYLGDFLRQKIWEPLNMVNTFYGGDELEKRQRTQDMAIGYGYDAKAQEYFTIPWPVQPEGSGAGEMISNVLDYAKFLKCMINKTGPISEKGHEELVKPRIVTDDELKPFMSHTCYALGWEMFSYHGELIIGHSGAVNGFSSKMIFIPRLKWGFVSFTNSDNGYQVQQKICWSLFYELVKVPLEKHFDWDGDFQEWQDKDHPKTKEELYPNLPEKPLPTSLELSAYAGEYYHPGYESHVVELKDGKLQVDGMDRTVRYNLTLIHATGEFFVAEIFFVDERNPYNARAEFRIGPDGDVKSFGVDYIEALEGEKIWFERRKLKV